MKKKKFKKDIEELRKEIKRQREMISTLSEKYTNMAINLSKLMIRCNKVENTTDSIAQSINDMTVDPDPEIKKQYEEELSKAKKLSCEEHKICKDCKWFRMIDPLHMIGDCPLHIRLFSGELADDCPKYIGGFNFMPDLRVIVDNLNEAEYFYGGENIDITPEEFEALKQGKILNVGINGDEYGITIRLSDDILNSVNEAKNER